MKKLLLMVSLTTILSAHDDHGIMEPIDTVESSGLRQEIYPVHPEIKGVEAIRFRPIGYFHTNYSASTGAPRQGILEPETKATIEIDSTYRKGLKDLSYFDHIIVLYHFDQTKTWSPTVNPPKSKHHFGLFATRSPKRPNPIGFSVVRLDSLNIKTGTLYLSGVDAFEGTPVLDIKPYLPSIDIVKSIRNEQTELELGHHDEKMITDSTFFK